MLRMLIATDFSPNADLALFRALALAAASGASLRVVHVRGAATPAGDDSISQRLMVRCRAQAAPDTRVEFCLRSGEPVDSILEAADEFDPDLIVIGGHGAMRLHDAWLGTTATQLLRRSNVPVLVVRCASLRPYRRVLAALDGTTAAEGVLRLAARVAAVQDVFAVHAFEDRAEAYAGNAFLADEVEREHREAIESVIARVGPSVASVHIHECIERGDAFRVIQAAVRQVEPDLLVLGTRGRYGLARLLRDSIAEDALAYFDMDMLIARTGECEPLIDW